MFKKILLTFIMLSGMSAFGAENYLNSVVIDKNDGKTSVIFRSDEVTKVKRDAESSDKIIYTLKKIKQSRDITTLYKNISDVNGLIIQNDGNDLKVYIEAPDISKAEVVFETPNSAPVSAGNTNAGSKTIWAGISVLILLAIMQSAKNVTVKPEQKDINEIIKEREKALYRKFQKEISTLPSMNYKLKSYSKHVLKGETIRSYESRMSKL